MSSTRESLNVCSVTERMFSQYSRLFYSTQYTEDMGGREIARMDVLGPSPDTSNACCSVAEGLSL